MSTQKLRPGVAIRIVPPHPLAGHTGTIVRIEASHVWVLLSDGHQTPLLLHQVTVVDEPVRE